MLSYTTPVFTSGFTFCCASPVDLGLKFCWFFSNMSLLWCPLEWCEFPHCVQTPHSGSESTTLWMLPRSSALGQAWIPRASLLALPLPSPWMLRRLARLRWKSPTPTRQVSSAIHSFIFPGVTCVAFFLFIYSLLCSHTGDITLILQLSRQQHSSINYTKQNHFF